jgi:hypothetical protein
LCVDLRGGLCHAYFLLLLRFTDRSLDNPFRLSAGFLPGPSHQLLSLFLSSRYDGFRFRSGGLKQTFRFALGFDQLLNHLAHKSFSIGTQGSSSNLVYTLAAWAQPAGPVPNITPPTGHDFAEIGNSYPLFAMIFGGNEGHST